MKLKFIIENKEGTGGGTYSIFKFAENLASRGHDITIFAARYPKFFKHDRIPTNLKIKNRHAIPRLFKGCGKIDQIWGNIYEQLFLYRYFEKTPDIDYVIGYQKEPAIEAAKLGKKYNIPIANFVFECPTWLEKELGEDWLKYYRKPSMKKSWDMFKKSLLDSNVIFANSELTKEESEKWLNKKIDAVIYPGIDTRVADSISQEQNIENQIIYIGRLDIYKNIDDVIKALSKLNNPPKFIICGEGGERKKLQELAMKLNVNCEFKGMVTEYEKWKQIKKSKFMVFTTSFEGFGMPPMESLYCERPCIVSDIHILREVYEDKVEYVKLHDINQLARKMQELLDDSEYCRKRGEEGREYVKNKYSWVRAAEKIETCCT